MALAAVGVMSFAIVEMVKVVLRPRLWINMWLFRLWLYRRDQSAKKEEWREIEKSIIDMSVGGATWLLYSLPVEKMAGQINTAIQTALAYPAVYPHIITAFATSASPKDLDRLIDGPPSDEDTAAINAFVAARNRVTNVMQRNLDAIQIRFNGIWTVTNHIAAVIISVIIIFNAVDPARIDGGVSPLNLFFIAVLGGMVAPVAKDLVTSLKKVKERAR